MFHLLGFSGSLVLNTMSDFTGLVDQVFTRSASSSVFILPRPMKMLAAAVMSPGMVRARLSSPTLRQINLPFIRPMIRSQRPQSGNEICWFADQPLDLPAGEEITPQALANTDPGPDTGFCLLWMAERIRPVPPGDIFTARLTATFAAVANVWTLGNMTLETSLPPGTYAIVGSEHISATAVAHRVQLPNQVFRPGSISHQANADLQDWRLLTRRLGVYGSFENTAPPSLEVLCTAADAAHEIYLQLVKVAGPMTV